MRLENTTCKIKAVLYYKRLPKEVAMTKIRVNCFGLSLDGYGAGPDQSLDNPLGVGGEALHEWVYDTRTFRAMLGNEGGVDGVDEDYAAAGIENLGAWILGRSMFSPIRGAWPDDE